MTPRPAGPGCELLAAGFLQEPVSAVSSAAYVVAAVVVLGQARRRGVGPGAVRPREVAPFAALVAGIGVGSFVQHGPDPAWSDLAHDLPLAATLCLVAADGVAALRSRPRRWWWWVAPTALLVPAILLVPRPADAAQAVVAGVAVVVTLLRARAEPAVRARALVAVGLLALGGLVGTLSRAGGPLCDPASVWQGHAAWHVLSAAALVVLAPALGGVRARGSRPAASGRA
ncbi:hypothetical protein [Actinotalea sp. Marseille-Q4924]|uniref:hypothetical protein n=1 Tax=Actinotalea sp. Marseille-Q4924 TaxID=2866571 RepID=UPI001CE41C67|nr:hypothetical protein [Actinotalea sp. Marseille-Q4924]